jgi:hypothetical protein
MRHMPVRSFSRLQGLMEQIEFTPFQRVDSMPEDSGARSAVGAESPTGEDLFGIQD